jgi:hypothetical protein
VTFAEFVYRALAGIGAITVATACAFGVGKLLGMLDDEAVAPELEREGAVRERLHG